LGALTVSKATFENCTNNEINSASYWPDRGNASRPGLEGNTSLCGDVMNGALQNEILHVPHDLTYLEDDEGFHGEVADYLEEDT
jgi:hypothetical protein